MKYKLNKILVIILVCFCISLKANIVFAHPGRTDANGGHKDNKNASGLGPYHYHCGGHPAHLHENGICPYSATASTQSKEASSNKKASSKTDDIEVREIMINEKIEVMTVGETKKLSVSITPENANNKDITWTSMDNTIVTIDNFGKITAKKAGIVTVIATSSNGKSDKIQIEVEELEKENLNEIKNSISNESSTNNEEDLNALSRLATLGLLGGGGYYIKKKLKSNKKAK